MIIGLENMLNRLKINGSLRFFLVSYMPLTIIFWPKFLRTAAQKREQCASKAPVMAKQCRDKRDATAD